MPAPAVTLAVPCRDAGRHLQPMLESLLAQSRQDFALLLVDDGSRDGSPALARRIAGDRIMVVEAQQPRGLAGNFQFCASLVRTPFFCLAHQDDLYDGDYLARMLPALEARPNAAIAHCRALAVDGDGNVLPGPAEQFKSRFWCMASPADRAATYRRLFAGNFICCPSVLFRTEPFRAVGGFCTDFAFALDWELWLRLVRSGFEVVGVDAVLLHYRRHAAASSRAHTRDLVRFREELELLVAARRLGIASGLLAPDTRPSPALRNNLLHEALDDLRGGDRDGALVKLRFLREQAPELWHDPYVRTFRALCRLGAPGRALLAAGRALAVRLGLGGARQCDQRGRRR